MVMGVNDGVRNASEVVGIVGGALGNASSVVLLAMHRRWCFWQCIGGGAFGNASSVVIGCLASLLISMDTSKILESQQGQRVSPLPPPTVGQISPRCQDSSSVMVAPRFELCPAVQGGSREREMVI
jgi:hypothetical protein